MMIEKLIMIMIINIMFFNFCSTIPSNIYWYNSPRYIDNDDYDIDNINNCTSNHKKV